MSTKNNCIDVSLLQYMKNFIILIFSILNLDFKVSEYIYVLAGSSPVNIYTLNSRSHFEPIP